MTQHSAAALSGQWTVKIILYIWLPLTTIAKEVGPGSYVWGPGLRSGVTVPSRHFFIQAVDIQSGENFTSSPGKDSFQVDFLNPNEQPVACTSELLDRHDGSFLCRYRLWKSVKEMHIIVRTASGQGVGKYVLQNVYDEDCFCPQRTDVFTSNMNCPKHIDQIDSDLQQFRSVDLETSIPESIRRFSDQQGACFVHYTIVTNKIYAKVHGPHTDFRMFSDVFLLSLTRKVHLPDVEFIVNLGDWPQERRVNNEKPLPIFSWCGSNDTTDIVMPTYDMTEATVESMLRVEMDMQSIQSLPKEWQWNKKRSQAIWRGRDSREERLNLIRLSRKNKNLIDAAITNYFFFLEQEKELGKADYMSFYDFFKYKYQLNIDGTVAAYRFPWLLAGGSLVFKQDSIYYEHFYNQLKPFKHYVPIKHDLSDLVAKLQWAKENDEEAEEIARNGLEFARANLMPENVYCYYFLLFSEYSKLLSTKPTVRNGMKLLDQPKKGDCKCETKGWQSLLSKEEL